MLIKKSKDNKKEEGNVKYYRLVDEDDFKQEEIEKVEFEYEMFTKESVIIRNYSYYLVQV